jgi:hypothetical protein
VQGDALDPPTEPNLFTQAQVARCGRRTACAMLILACARRALYGWMRARAQAVLGWRPRLPIETALRWTAEW